jgi:1-acyl-sn-glycerol-3-phosphate acyltransferase
LAITAQIPVVPVAITGSREIMPKGGWAVRSGTITVRFGEPILTKGLTIDDRNTLTTSAFSAVAGLMDEDVEDPATNPGIAGVDAMSEG